MSILAILFVCKAAQIYELNKPIKDFIQNKQEQIFFYQPRTQDANNYIRVELRVKGQDDGNSQLLFIGSLNKLPQFDGSIIQADYQDQNGYLTKKIYNYLELPPQNYLQNDTYYFSVQIPQFTIYIYDINVVTSQIEPCPNNCNSNKLQGSCLNGLCSCSQNFIDLDCSKKAPLIQINKQLQQQLVQGMKYFYYQPEQQYQEITLSINGDHQQELMNDVFVYLLFENQIIGSANKDIFNMTDTLKQNQTQILFKIKQNLSLIQNRTSRILITVQSQYQAFINIKIQQSQDDSSSNIYIVLTSVLAPTIIFLLATYILVKYIKHRDLIKNSRVYQEQQFRVQAVLTEEDNKYQILQKYVTRMQYQYIFDQPQFLRKSIVIQSGECCSVCLADFMNTDDCRYCPCLHIFHTGCFDKWWIKHQNCPNCRMSLTKEELIKYDLEEAHKVSLEDRGDNQFDSIRQSRKRTRLTRAATYVGILSQTQI